MRKPRQTGTAAPGKPSVNLHLSFVEESIHDCRFCFFCRASSYVFGRRLWKPHRSGEVAIRHCVSGNLRGLQHHQHGLCAVLQMLFAQAAGLLCQQRCRQKVPLPKESRIVLRRAWALDFAAFWLVINSLVIVTKFIPIP